MLKPRATPWEDRWLRETKPPRGAIRGEALIAPRWGLGVFRALLPRALPWALTLTHLWCSRKCTTPTSLSEEVPCLRISSRFAVLASCALSCPDRRNRLRQEMLTNYQSRLAGQSPR